MRCTRLFIAFCLFSCSASPRLPLGRRSAPVSGYLTSFYSSLSIPCALGRFCPPAFLRLPTVLCHPTNTPHEKFTDMPTPSSKPVTLTLFSVVCIQGCWWFAACREGPTPQCQCNTSPDMLCGLHACWHLAVCGAVVPGAVCSAHKGWVGGGVSCVQGHWEGGGGGCHAIYFTHRLRDVGMSASEASCCIHAMIARV